MYTLNPLVLNLNITTYVEIDIHKFVLYYHKKLLLQQTFFLTQVYFLQEIQHNACVTYKKMLLQKI